MVQMRMLPSEPALLIDEHLVIADVHIGFESGFASGGICLVSSAEKAKTAVHEGRVKLHVFEPSGRQVWTVVGKSGEHWVDKETEFCSCSAYFFGKMRDGKGCYHVSSVQMSGTNVQRKSAQRILKMMKESKNCGTLRHS